MATKISLFILLLFLSPGAFAVDIDEALPHYGPALQPMAFSNGAIFIPLLVLGVDIDEAMPHYGPNFNSTNLFSEVDLDGQGAWLPLILSIKPGETLPDCGPLYVFGVLICPDGALPQSLSPAPEGDIDEALPHYGPFVPLGPPVDIDEALPHYGPIAALFSDPDVDIADIWLPLAIVDPEKEHPLGYPPACFCIDTGGILWLTFYSSGAYWAAPIEEMAPVDIDEALPHY